MQFPPAETHLLVLFPHVGFLLQQDGKHSEDRNIVAKSLPATQNFQVRLENGANTYRPPNLLITHTFFSLRKKMGRWKEVPERERGPKRKKGKGTGAQTRNWE